MTDIAAIERLLPLMFQAHPWHGVPAKPEGAATTGSINAYIEFVPMDTVKYELDKASGHLKVDRPQRFSSLCPTLYGFVPQTYCGEAIGERARSRTKQPVVLGDEDPLDICVITERTFAQGAFLLRARPLGGFRLIDKDRADDKIIAVLEDDGAYGHFRDLSECPAPLIERLRHYFLTYKRGPGGGGATVEQPIDIAETYGAEEAREVIRLSEVDYVTKFGEPSARVHQLAALLSG